MSVEAGIRHSAFITSKFDFVTIAESNGLFVCGRGTEGQLGVGEADNVFNAVKVMERVAKVACGEQHTMILSIDRKVFVSGSNKKFQLGLPESI